MAGFAIEITEEAKADLDYYSAYERKIVTAGTRSQLTHQPAVETKNKKKLRDNPVAPWELRCGKYGVFYEADETSQRVTILAVGHKEHNMLLIRGNEARI